MICALIAILASIINLLTASNMGNPLLNNSSLPFTVLNLLSSLILPLFILMLASDLFSGELSDNSIIMSLVRPITRNKLYISKILAIGISMLGILLGTFLISLIASLIGGDFSQVLSKFLQNFIAYIFAIIPMMLIAIISLLFTPPFM